MCIKHSSSNKLKHTSSHTRTGTCDLLALNVLYLGKHRSSFYVSSTIVFTLKGTLVASASKSMPISLPSHDCPLKGSIDEIPFHVPVGT